MFNIFINYLDSGVECTLSRSVEDMKLGGVADSPGSCAASQRDLDRWADKNAMEWNRTARHRTEQNGTEWDRIIESESWCCALYL